MELAGLEGLSFLAVLVLLPAGVALALIGLGIGYLRRYIRHRDSTRKRT